MQWFIEIIKDWVLAQGYVTLAEVLAEIQGTRLQVYRSASTQTIPSGVWTKVQLNNVLRDFKDEFDKPTFTWTAKEHGYYLISFSVGFRPTLGVGENFIARLNNDGYFPSRFINHSSTNNYITAANSVLMLLSVGATLNLDCYHSSGFDVNLDYTQQMTYLCVERAP